MFELNWYSVGNYTVAILITTSLILGIMHFVSKGKVWKSFTPDSYKCGMVQMLSVDDVPNLTSIYDSQIEAGSKIKACNTPQAFIYGTNLCTLKDGNYTCRTNPT
jgi:hypothetical protein